MADSSPFRGLAPYGPEDADFFFGRGREIELIAANIYASPLTLLFGPSGVGKTSLVQAGLIPRLSASDDFVAVDVRSWGGSPVEAVLAALEGGAPGAASAGEIAAAVELVASANSDRRVALVLDQFEDVFLRRPGDEELGEQLSEAMLRPGTLSVLIAIREESLAELDRLEEQIPGIFETVIRLDYLDRATAASSVVDALRVWNERVAPDEQVTLEAGLLDEVLEGVPARDPGHVETAHLQLVLERLWDAGHESGELRRASLEALGGPKGIVRDHVRNALDALDERERELAAAAIDRLVTPSGQLIAQQAVDLAVFAGIGESDIRGLLDRLSKARIVRPIADREEGDERWEIYHPLLADAALGWRREFVTERRVAEERALARLRYRRLLIGAVVVALVLATTGALVTYALLQRQAARAQALTADARAVLWTDPPAGLALAVRAYDTKSTPETEAVLRTALGEAAQRASVVADSGRPIRSVAFAPGGGPVFTAGDGGIQIWGELTPPPRTRPGESVQEAVPCGGSDTLAVADADGGRLVAVREPSKIIRLTNEHVVDIACSADGSVVAVAGVQRVRIFKGRPPRELTAFPYPPPGSAAGPGAIATSVALTPDGKVVAVAGEDGAVVRPVAGDGAPVRLQAPEDATSTKFASIAFDPSGARVVTGGSDGVLRVWPRAGGRSRDLKGHQLEVRGVAYSSDGSLVASASTDGTLRVWDEAAGVPVAVLRGHTAALTSVAFGRGDRFLLSGSEDGTARLWANPVVAVLRGHTTRVISLAYAGNGRLLSVSADGELRVWDAVTGAEERRLPEAPPANAVRASRSADVVAVLGQEGELTVWRSFQDPKPHVIGSANDPVGAADVSRDGTAVVFADGDSVQILDVRSGERTLIIRLRPPEAVLAVAFDGPGRRVAVSGADGRIRIVDAATRRVVMTLDGSSPSSDVLWTPDGERIVAGGHDGAIRVWETDSGRLRAALRGHEGVVLAVSATPDSRLVASAGSDGTVRVWHLATALEVQTLEGVTAAFAPGGRTIAAGGPGATLRLYDCRVCGDPARLREQADGVLGRD